MLALWKIIIVRNFQHNNPFITIQNVYIRVYTFFTKIGGMIILRGIKAWDPIHL